jgi:hypothetical protein
MVLNAATTTTLPRDPQTWAAAPSWAPTRFTAE